MTPSEYKPIILKCLTDKRKHNSVEDLATFIVAKMEVYAEMLSLAGAGAVLQGPSAASSVQPEPAVLTGNPQAQAQLDISERIMPTTVAYSEEEIIEMKKSAVDTYKAILPPLILVQPAGFPNPIELELRGVENSMAAMPFIAITYAPKGSNAVVSVRQSVTSPLLSGLEVVSEVEKQATAIYFSAPKVVRTLPPAGMNASLEERLSGALGAETDRNLEPVTGDVWGAKVNWRSSVSNS